MCTFVCAKISEHTRTHIHTNKHTQIWLIAAIKYYLSDPWKIYNKIHATTNWFRVLNDGEVKIRWCRAYTYRQMNEWASQIGKCFCARLYWEWARRSEVKGKENEGRQNGVWDRELGGGNEREHKSINYGWRCQRALSFSVCYQWYHLCLSFFDFGKLLLASQCWMVQHICC